MAFDANAKTENQAAPLTAAQQFRLNLLRAMADLAVYRGDRLVGWQYSNGNFQHATPLDRALLAGAAQ